MKIMVNLENTDTFQEVSMDGGSSVLDFKMLLQTIFNIPFTDIELSLRGVKLNDPNARIDKLNFGDDIVVLSRKPLSMTNNIFPNISLGQMFDNSMRNIRGQSNQSHIQAQNQPTSLSQQFDSIMHKMKTNQSSQEYFSKLSKDIYIKNEVKKVKEKYMTTPSELNMLFNTNPELAEIIVSEDDKKLEEYIRKRVDDYESQEKIRQQEYQTLMNSDPNDPKAQEKIAELIRQKNIDENLKYAEEYLPETLIPIHMLYINLTINKKNVVALVDTGAQTTIISKNLAEKCDLFNLCDTRFSGIAKGVGTSKILGTIHAAQIKIEEKFIMCKITVLENNSVGFIFGLDNMRSYRCSVDLSKNALIFPDAGICAKFLSDGEIKKIQEEEDKKEELEEIEKAKKASKEKK